MAAGDVRHFKGVQNIADGARALSAATVLNNAGTANIEIKVNRGILNIGNSPTVTSGFQLQAPAGGFGHGNSRLQMVSVVLANMSVIAVKDDTDFEVLATYTA